MTYPRYQLQDHIAQCPDEIIPCTFSEVGCKETVKRQMLQKHLESNIVLHQTFMCQAVIEQTRKLKLQNTAIQGLTKGSRDLQNKICQLNQEQFIFQETLQTLDVDKRKLEKNVFQLTEEVTMLKNPSNNGHWIKNMKLAFSKLKLSNWPFYLSKMVEITAIESIIPAIFKVSLTVTKNICQNHQCTGGCHSSHYSAPSYSSPPFYSHPSGYKLYLLVKVVCHCPCCCKESLDNSGLLTFEDYQVRFHYERPRYAHDKIIDEDYLSLSVELSAMRGEYDTQLKWPLEKCITVTLLNEKNNDDHISIKNDYVGRNAHSQLMIKLSPGKKPQQVGIVKHTVSADNTHISKCKKTDRFRYIPSNAYQADPEISNEQCLQRVQDAYVSANPNCILFSLNSAYGHKYVNRKPPCHIMELFTRQDKYIGECDCHFYLEITM